MISRCSWRCMPGNITLSPHDRIGALDTLAMLEGPERSSRNCTGCWTRSRPA